MMLRFFVSVGLVLFLGSNLFADHRLKNLTDKKWRMVSQTGDRVIFHVTAINEDGTGLVANLTTSEIGGTIRVKGKAESDVGGKTNFHRRLFRAYSDIQFVGNEAFAWVVRGTYHTGRQARHPADRSDDVVSLRSFKKKIGPLPGAAAKVIDHPCDEEPDDDILEEDP